MPSNSFKNFKIEEQKNEKFYRGSKKYLQLEINDAKMFSVCETLNDQGMNSSTSEIADHGST